MLRLWNFGRKIKMQNLIVLIKWIYQSLLSLGLSQLLRFSPYPEKQFFLAVFFNTMRENTVILSFVVTV